MQNAISWFAAKPKWFRVSTYLVLVYFTYALLLGVLAPAILKTKLPQIVEEQTGRKASVADIAINPFLLKVDVRNFTIYASAHSGVLSESQIEKETTNTQPDSRFFSVGHMSLDVGFWHSVFTLTPAVEKLSIDAPFVTVARLNNTNNTQTFNFSDILEHVAQQTPETDGAPSESENGQIPHITLGEFSLTHGHVIIEDRVTDTLLNYPELEVALQDLDTHAVLKDTAQSASVQSANDAASKGSTSAFNQYQFTLVTAEKGKISIDGEFQLSPLKLTTSVDIDDIALVPLWSLGKHLIAANLADGTVSVSLHAEIFEEKDAFQFLLQHGEFEINNLLFKRSPISNSKGGKDILSIPSFAVHNINVDALQQQVNIERVSLDAPHISAVYDKSGIDLQRLFTPKNVPGVNANTNTAADNSSLTASQPASLSAKEDSGVQTADEPLAQAAKSAPSAEVDAESTAQNTSERNEWQVVLQQFVFNGGTLDIEERGVSAGTFLRVSNINIETGSITTDFTAPISYSTNFQVSADPERFSSVPQGAFSSAGSVTIAKQAIKGSAALDALVLSQFQQYVSPYAKVTLESGAVNLDVTFEGSAAGDLNVNASTRVEGLSILDTAQTPLLQWEALSVEDIKFDRNANQLRVETVHLTAPFARLIIDEAKQTNISKLFAASEQDVVKNESTNREGNDNLAAQDAANSNGDGNGNGEAESKSATSSTSEAAFSELAIAVGGVSIENGRAYFADPSLTPKFASAIESLNGKVSGIDSRSNDPASVDITGKIDNYAPVKLAGTIHPLKQDLDLDLNFSVKGAELTSVNPYSGTYMGYYIDKGLLSLAVQYKLNGDQLDGQNHVIIDQLTLGKKSNSDQALSLPLGLAIALLEDRNGVIDLGLDVSGDVDSPDFSFGSIILNAIGNIITKAVTAPFSLLANLVGSDDELDSAEFAFGASTLSPAVKEKLDTLAKALNKRPGLRVNIEGTVNAVSDASALAQRQLNNTLLIRSGLVDSSSTSGTADMPANGAVNSSQASPITGSSIPLDGPLADALLAYYVDVFTPDLNQEYTNMVVQLYPELASESQEPSQVSTKDNQSVIKGDDVKRALSIARYNKLRNSIDIPESELILLADARSKAVKSYLANDAEIEANRLFLLNTQHDLHTEFSGVELSLEAK